MPIDPSGVSVIVCCHNSESRIETTLRHLAAQETAKGLPWEIVLVDNNCTDKTVHLAQKTWRELGRSCELRVLSELTPGLNAARKCGATHARFEYVILCDDDNWLAPSYLSNVLSVFQSHPNVGVCGGISSAVTDGELPYWFDGLADCYAIGPQGNTVGKTDASLFGAGMGVRRSILANVYSRGFTPALSDRTGRSLSSGGDGEINYWAQMQGFDRWYSPNLTFQHFIPADRLNLSYVRRLHRGFGEARVLLDVYKRVLNGKRTNCVLEFAKSHLRAARYGLFGIPGKPRSVVVHRMIGELIAVSNFARLRETHLRVGKLLSCIRDEQKSIGRIE